MIRFLKDWAIRRNIYFAKTTEESKLKELLKAIRPVKAQLIRLGDGPDDAGYLIPDDLEGIKNCFSPGVSTESYFEDALSRMGIKSYMADHSVMKPTIQNNQFDFIQKHVGFEIKPHFISLENWIKEKENVDKDMILQMDIEGGEYNVLIETSNEVLRKFRIIVIEFHKFDAILNVKSADFIASCLYKLLKDFYVVHIHPNNCARPVRYKQFEIPPTLEFTFLRKDRISTIEYADQFPHPLDKVNVPKLKEVILPACFYKDI